MGSKHDEHATFVEVIPLTLQQALPAFLKAVQAEKRKPYTIAVYRRCIQRLIHFLENGSGIANIADVRSEHLRDFFIALGETHNVGGVEVYYRPIRYLFRWYWDEYEIDGRNPITRVKVAHAKAKRRKGIPLETVELLHDACRTRNRLRDQAVILGLIDTCARASEFCSFRVKDVDLVTGEAAIIAGKGDKDRVVRFAKRSLRALRRYLKTRPALSKNERLFAADDGGPLDRFSLRHLIDRRADDAGVKHYGLHDFRRRGAYELYLRTRNIEFVSVYLGHSNVKVTERYLGIEDDDLLEEANEAGSPLDDL